MDERSLSALEFDLLRDELLARATCPEGRRRLAALRPSSKLAEVARRQAWMTEMLELAEQARVPTFEDVPEIRDLLEALGVADTTLTGQEIRTQDDLAEPGNSTLHVAPAVGAISEPSMRTPRSRIDIERTSQGSLRIVHHSCFQVTIAQ